MCQQLYLAETVINTNLGCKHYPATLVRSKHVSYATCLNLTEICKFSKLRLANTREIFIKAWYFNYWAIKGNLQFVQNATFGLWEEMIAQLQKMFCKTPMNTRATISVILLCKIAYAEALFEFAIWLENRCSRNFYIVKYVSNFIHKWLQHLAKFSRAPIF